MKSAESPNSSRALVARALTVVEDVVYNTILIVALVVSLILLKQKGGKVVAERAT